MIREEFKNNNKNEEKSSKQVKYYIKLRIIYFVRKRKEISDWSTDSVSNSSKKYKKSEK